MWALIISFLDSWNRFLNGLPHLLPSFLNTHFLIKAQLYQVTSLLKDLLLLSIDHRMRCNFFFGMVLKPPGICHNHPFSSSNKPNTSYIPRTGNLSVSKCVLRFDLCLCYSTSGMFSLIIFPLVQMPTYFWKFLSPRKVWNVSLNI